MTPHILDQTQHPNGLWTELSTDDGSWSRAVDGLGPIYGVTVLRSNGSDPGLSKSFRDKTEALAYVQTIRQGAYP